ncbi:MAG: hypothetical protein H0W68_08385 [Gemmatimonadaceae bacterium]|nr:hypothetical protein [Gemmatimonadaceae bacterium]
MTLAGWLDTREPRPPRALTARLRSALGDALDRDAGEATTHCLAAGERLVRELIAGQCTTRDVALDLLAADALMTYAFEAAGERPGSIATLAADAMNRIAAIAGAGRMAS